MLKQTVKDLTGWFEEMDTDEELASAVRSYLLAQGTKTMEECLEDSPQHRELVWCHDRLGWDNFVEGKLPVEYIKAHRAWTKVGHSETSPEVWGRGFISCLLHVTHKQWLFRNAKIHFKKGDVKTEAQHKKIIKRVRELMWIDPAELLKKHRYLLEDDFAQLGEKSAPDKEYWISTVESSMTVAEHVRRRNRGDR